MVRKCLLLLLFTAMLSSLVWAQEVVLYKEVDTTRLYLEVYPPQVSDDELPAMVFFFGGGWKNGNRHHFLNQAKYLSKRGLVCFLVDYRTESKHQTKPFACVKDAKSAIRFIRKNASDFNIDPDKIIASGGSAGGHLAAATALVSGYNENTDDLSVSCVPNALVLFNPVIDNGPGGYGYDRIGAAFKQFSPLHNIDEGAPPTLFMLGTEDPLIPVATAKYYQTVMEKVGSRCELKLYQGAVHGFFNYQHFENYKQTLIETDAFLQSLGYLDTHPEVTID